jgi:pimeloyl-ACP methyl ester carboxylesterase
MSPVMPGAPAPRVLFGRDDRALVVRLMMLDTDDGKHWDAVLFRPRVGLPVRRRLAVVVVHGSVGNYLTGLPRRVAFGLAGVGFTVLSINTRMANYGVFFGGGLMHKTPIDIDAALDLLRRLGYKRIVLCGFSMGSTMVTHYQALRRPDDVVGVATLAHPASLPAALRGRWQRFGAVPSYGEVTDIARESLSPDPESSENDRIFIVRRAMGMTDSPLDAEIWTYRTWWFSRGPEAPHAESRLRIGSVTVPIALFQAGEDELIAPSEGAELAAIARQGSAPSVELDTIPGADHVFARRDRDLVEAVAGWLDGLVEP